MKYSHLPLWLSIGKINCVASIFSIVALQCRVSFHYTAKGISAMFTCISSFFNFLPSQLTTEHWVELPVIHSRFTNYLFHKCYKQCIHANVNPPINPTYSFPPWYLYICSLHLCLYFLFADKIIYTTFLDFTYNVLIRYFSLTSVCMTVSRYIHVSASGTISLLFMANIPLYIYTTSLSIPVLFSSGGQSIGASASAWVLPMNIQVWLPLGLTGLISLLSKGVFSSTTVEKHSSFSTHGLQHARLPCPSPTSRACLNSCASSQWCPPTISSSVIPFSSCVQSFPASGPFIMSQFFTSDGQGIGASASVSVLPINIQDWFPLGLPGWISFQSKGLSRVFSHTTVQKHQFFDAWLSLWSNSHIHTWLLEKP